MPEVAGPWEGMRMGCKLVKPEVRTLELLGSKGSMTYAEAGAEGTQLLMCLKLLGRRGMVDRSEDKVFTMTHRGALALSHHKARIQSMAIAEEASLAPALASGP
jgi:hypothetical protein